MEKVIDLNQLQTENGIDITIKRIVLSAAEMKIYALKTPNNTQPGILQPPSWEIAFGTFNSHTE